MDTMLSMGSGQDSTVYQSYDGGDRSNAAHDDQSGTPWHRRITPEVWVWLVVVGAIGGLWAIAGSFRKVLS